MHRSVATYASADRDAILAAISATEADLHEVRFDTLWAPDTTAEQITADLVALAEAEAPVLATLRPKRQGGHYDGAEEVRVNLLAAAGEAGFAVDIEADDGPILPAIKQHARDVLVSDHTMSAAPSRDDGLLRLLAMHDLGTGTEKLAFPSGSFLDTLRALELCRAHAQRQGGPAIAPMGDGAMVRALLAVVGNRLTYGHAAAMPPAVTGQPALADIRSVWDHWGLGRDELGPTGGRDWFAVLGGSVRHSLSPAIHNAALRVARRSERFGALDVPDSLGAMRLLATVADRIGLRGASVTNPLKLHAFAVGEPDETAAAVGAANCLRFTDLVATNTDATAMRRLLEPHAPRSVLILGAGGAARAAIHAAQACGAEVTFTSRDAERAAAVQDHLGAQWTPWAERAVHAADWIIQATPIHDQLPLPSKQIASADGIVEMVYGTSPTPFQAAAGPRATVIDGRQFLVAQAVDAYRFWLGDDADAEAMEAAL